ncbi:hypothetical protein D9757_004671 [Collybiopsis confluens]|uniref:Methyltransferase domain-containing protein n=1 Tax=Collybiopsis confluens TaxID=2823264 RepID=A0A8H5HSP7_9AGAR|nr:hypothetical protein D9757_004671 [Collybiopsis confluens]
MQWMGLSILPFLEFTALSLPLPSVGSMKHTHTLSSSVGSTASSPPRSSAAASFFSPEARRTTRLRETLFTTKYGRKLHSFEPEKAPYPYHYDKDILELEHLDVRFVKYLRQGSVTFVDFPEEACPEKCLDLGCGTGSWVIEAAKEWPHCEFVGFDLMNVQIPLNILDSSLGDRIQWTHGNFLTNRLSFEDDTFDHIHLSSIATSVPENKWGVLFDEICRVLRPGGSIEMVEDDVIFPVLPRSFTAPMRARRSASVHLPEGSIGRSSIPESEIAIPTHDHALLESLYKSVFEHRFVNMKPSAVLPSYFTAYFRHVTLAPVLSFPMPPLPPLRALPPQMPTAYMPLGLDLDQRMSFVPSSLSTARPGSLSFSSAMSKESTSDQSHAPGESSSSFSTEVNDALTSVIVSDTDSSQIVEEESTLGPRELYMLETSGLADSTTPSVPLVARGRLDSLNERSLAMHLFRSYSYVLGCQEALWEELKDRIRNRKQELEPFGWEDEEEFEEVQNRKKFEKLLKRYQSDMQSRISLWCSLEEVGWAQPVREPLTKAELIEEERKRAAISGARNDARSEDLQQMACRSIRILVGFKA